MRACVERVVVVVVVVVIVEVVVGIHACMGDAACMKMLINSYTPRHHHRGKHGQHGDAPQRRGSSVAVFYDSFWRPFGRLPTNGTELRNAPYTRGSGSTRSFDSRTVIDLSRPARRTNRRGA